MRKLRLLAGVAIVLSLVVAGPAGGQADDEASGRVLMTVHTHSSGVLLFPSDRLPYDFEVGDTFAYSSRLCRGNAPFNDLGLNFDPDYPGVDDDDGTAPVRHGVQGRVTALHGGRGRVEATVRTVLCVRGTLPNGQQGQVESGNVLVWHFQAAFGPKTNNDLFISGRFQFDPDASTGTFEDITGRGTIQARFTCLSALSSPGANCAAQREFHDFVASRGNPRLRAGELLPGVSGTFRDPTVGPVLGPV